MEQMELTLPASTYAFTVSAPYQANAHQLQ